MLEIIATCVDDAIAIWENGGQRIELVSGLVEGGLTPSYGLIKHAVERVRLPINVMIKPHAQSSIYSEQDLETMIEDIKMVKDLGAKGVVLGLIDGDGDVDEVNLRRLLAVIGDLEVTFRRAIDETKNPVESARVLTKYPQITRILTSGGPGKITSNLGVIKEMVEVTKGKIDIMPGSGMSLANLEEVIKATGTSEVHFGTAVRKNGLAQGAIDPGKMKALAELYARICPDQ